MRVAHRLTVYAKCPTDDSKPDVYDVTVEQDDVDLDELLLVESILEAVAELTREPIFQEALTHELAARLDAKVTTVGRHFDRVETTVEEGFE